jgi:hypothetical protein
VIPSNLTNTSLSLEGLTQRLLYIAVQTLAVVLR